MKNSEQRIPSEKEAALCAMAADILRETDPAGRCTALDSPEFENGVAACIRSNGFATFLPDDRAEQERALRRFLAPYLRQKSEEAADRMILYEAQSAVMAARAACLHAAQDRASRGTLLSAERERELRQRLYSAAARFAAANRLPWVAADVSGAENDLAYAAGRQEQQSMQFGNNE